VVRSKTEDARSQTLAPDGLDQTLQGTRADGIGECVPSGLAQHAFLLEFGGRQMHSISEGTKQSHLIPLYGGGNGRPRPTGILPTECFDGSFRRRQRLPLEMSIHTRKGRQ
jgi:hypothetical protein